jgi:hypothetical protein
VFAAGGRGQVFRRGPDPAGRESRGNFGLAPFQKLEEPLGVFFFLTWAAK